jgi:5'-nucleotidase
MSAQTLSCALALASILSALTLAPAVGAPAPQFPDDAADTVRLQLLAVNDFHGALEPRTLGDRPVGGAAALAAYLDRHEQEAAAEGVPTIRVGSGDLIDAR